MNQENLAYLKNNLKYLGFGESLYPSMEKNIQQQFPSFQLHHATEFNQEKINATLHFRKGDTSDLYFFNKYETHIQKGNSEPLTQTFYINKGHGITLKEAFNLLNGRAVNKDLTNAEGKSYNAWLQIDFLEKDQTGNYKMKQFHENYGYNLQKSVENLPIKELADPQQKERLMQSLHKGNLQAVTIAGGQQDTKVFIEANPQFKSVNLYDMQMKRLPLENISMKQQDSKQNLNENSTPSVAQEQSINNTENPKKKSIKPELEKLPKKPKRSKGIGI